MLSLRVPRNPKQISQPCWQPRAQSRHLHCGSFCPWGCKSRTVIDEMEHKPHTKCSPGYVDTTIRKAYKL